MRDIAGELKEMEGVEGVMVTDKSGRILYGGEVPDFKVLGSMALVIADSSQKLVMRTGQGEFESSVIEFSRGKMIIINDRVQLLVLAGEDSNLGKILLFARRVLRNLLSHPEVLQSGPEMETMVTDSRSSSDDVQIEAGGEKLGETAAKPGTGTSKDEITSMEAPTKTRKETVIKYSETTPETMETDSAESNKVSAPSIPEVKPPLSFPELEPVEVPDDREGMKEAALQIYEHILLAMSIGASKIMGVAPAGGMLRKSLPYSECPVILRDVGIRSNASLDFEKLRDNVMKADYDLENIIEDLSKIIWSITENYGRIMGYDAFRGMVRPEFTEIDRAYSGAMKALGIRERIHPELQKIWDE
ncbi:roadblock/LC7 domain-containing protein [Methanothermobacter sp. THM-1]|uniref:roadblock/LC7 domain-containing protein n=1 Tax=Methanothermobacter sp. THM-1 TaxID=2606911 RepID=UPI001366CAB1|nr:roadblock/LC7 domain-containing protein [Methanothermobacter sp. THM-1]QHN05908.1 roadblock/LC7 domain-containing protein [Methanothermobacter sp. THM-1]